MAAADTARMIAELRLKDLLTPALAKAGKGIDKLDKNMGHLGQSAKRGASVAGKALLGIGTVAAVGIAAGVRSGLEDLATLESAVTSVDGAVQQMGLTGKVTGAQVATMANDIEASIGAAFDDKDIVQATTTLLRFGKVTPANLRPAMVVMTDLATKTGSVDSAASLLAKALADPEKAAGKLARTGVILTKEEQKQIKAFMKAGKAADAQKVILDSLTKSTKGAADASQGKYRRALSMLADVSEDAKKALAEGFLPVIERVADMFSKGLADPKVMDDIRSMGKSLAGAFDDAVTFAQKVPWGTIKDGLKTAAEWAGRLFDAFRSLPPEFQTTIVALAGLNKLSGGAISGIVGELGKGLIKGVLGIQAGVVNVTGGVVNGPGGLPGKGGGGVPGLPGGGGALAAIGGIAGFTAVAGVAAVALYHGVPALIPSKKTGSVGAVGTIPGSNPMAGLIRSLTPALKPMEAEQKRTTRALGTLPDIDRGISAQRQAIDNVKAATSGLLYPLRAAANQPAPKVSVSTNVNVNVSAASVSRAVSVRARYTGSSSRSGNGVTKVPV